MRNFLYLMLLSLLFSCSNTDGINRITGKWTVFDKKYILTNNELDTNPDGETYVSGNSTSLKSNTPILFGSIKKSISVTPQKNYALYISGILSSSKIWIDGKLVGEYGKIGHSLKESTPSIKRAILNFIPDSENVDIVIEFSNFHFKSSWLFKWIVYGESQDIINLYIRNQSKDYFTVGLLVMCTIVFLLMFFVHFKNRYNLYLALFTLSYGIRSYLIKNTTIQGFISIFPWNLEFQLNKASELWALSFIILFLRELYPIEFKSIFTKIIIYISTIVSFMSFIPLEYFNKLHILLLMHIIIIISGLYIIGKLIVAGIKHRFLAFSALASITLFFGSIVFDILANSIMITYDYYSAQFVILVVAVMFLMIGKKRNESTKNVLIKQEINREIKSVFSKFVPIEILETLNNYDLEDRPAGEYSVEPLTMVYIDIRDFTKLSENLSPKDNFTMINQFYEIVGDEVKKNCGYIESYGGDGVVAIFKCAPDNAIKASLQISNRVFNTSGIKIGMSIHFGKVVLGTIGGENRIQATAVSDVTRILSSMDNFNSKMGIELLITEIVFTLSSLPKNKVINIGSIILKDEEEAITLYQVIPENYSVDPLFKESFENGVKMIKYNKYSKAYAFFLLALKYNSSHQLTQYYIKELEIFFKLRDLTFTLKV